MPCASCQGCAPRPNPAWTRADTAQCHSVSPAGPLQGPALPGDDSGTQAGLVLHLQGQGGGRAGLGLLPAWGTAWGPAGTWFSPAVWGTLQLPPAPAEGTGSLGGSRAARGRCSEPFSCPGNTAGVPGTEEEEAEGHRHHWRGAHGILLPSQGTAVTSACCRSGWVRSRP